MKQTDLEKKIREVIGFYYFNDEDDTFGKLYRRITEIISQDRQSLVEEIRQKKMKLKNPDANLVYTQTIYNTAITDVLAIIERKK